MKVKIFILFIIFASYCNCNIWAQKNLEHHPSKEEFRKNLICFLTKEANLTSKEVAEFFPLYEECQKKKHQLNNQIRKIRKQAHGKQLTEKDYQNIIEKEAKIRIDIEKLEESYIKVYHKVLPYKKIFSIKRAETRFQRELLKGLKKK